MKRLFATIVMFFLASQLIDAQDFNTKTPPHLYNHTFPEITVQNPKIQLMLDQLKVENLQTDVDHLCSYLNRRADGRYIYEVKDWLVEQYKSFGIDSIYLHDFQPIPFWDSVPRPFQTAPNVIAIQPGKTKPNEIVICGGHFDSTVYYDEDYDVDTLRSPGADDNASGTAGILATARILSNYTFDRTIIYASWNAEEFGLCGSHAFAKDCASDSIDIVAYTNLDMTGYVVPGNDLKIHLLYTPCDSLLGDFMKQIVHTYYPEINVCQAWLAYGDTDYSSFNRHGYQAISLSEDVHNMSPYIHKINDIVGVSLNNYDLSMLFTGVTIAAVAELAGLNELSVDENVKENLQIYPNPTSNNVNFSEEVAVCEVFDLLGKKIYDAQNISYFDVSDWNTGIYVIRISDFQGNIVTNKLVVR